MELGVLADLAEILGGVTVIGGVLFGMIQISEYRAQRRDMVAVELVRSFQSPDFAHAIVIIREMADDTSLAEVRRKGTDYQDAAMMVATTYESIGLLAFRRVAQFSVVRELTGGLCVVMWRKLRTWTHEMRHEQQHDSFAEWFQWLAERLEQYGDDKNANPAHLRHANWRPKG